MIIDFDKNDLKQYIKQDLFDDFRMYKKSNSDADFSEAIREFTKKCIMMKKCHLLKDVKYKYNWIDEYIRRKNSKKQESSLL